MGTKPDVPGAKRRRRPVPTLATSTCTIAPAMLSPMKLPAPSMLVVTEFAPGGAMDELACPPVGTTDAASVKLPGTRGVILFDGAGGG